MHDFPIICYSSPIFYYLAEILIYTNNHLEKKNIMKGKETRKEKKKEKSDNKGIKAKSDYQNEKASKQDMTINVKPKKS